MCYCIFLPIISCPRHPQVCPPPAACTCCVACCCLPGALAGLQSQLCHLPLPELQARQDRNQSLRSPDSSEHCRWVLFSSFQHKGGNQELGCFLPTTHCCARKGEAKASKIAYHFTILYHSGFFLIGHSPGCCRLLVDFQRSHKVIFSVYMYFQCFHAGSTGLELPSWTSSVSAFWLQ